MCFAYIGNDAVIGFGYVDQRFYFTRVVGAHLNNRYFMLGFQLKQGKRHPDVVVEISFGVVHVVCCW